MGNFISDAVGAAAKVLGGAGGLLGAGATIGGAIIQGKAAKDASKDQQKAAQQQLEALARGDAASLALLQELVRVGRPGLRGLRGIAGATPESLTGEQGTQLGDLRRDNRATLATSGGRGSGRAGLFAAMEAERRFRESSAAENQRRKDSASYALANIGGRAIAGQANVTGQGALNQSQVLGSIGQANAAGSLARGDMWSTILGGGADVVAQLPGVYNSFRSIMASSDAAQERKSRFAADQRRAAGLGMGDV